MAQHAKLLGRKVTTDGVQLLFEISDDTAGVIGRTTLDNAPLETLKTELRAEADRLLALPVGTVIDL